MIEQIPNGFDPAHCYAWRRGEWVCQLWERSPAEARERIELLAVDKRLALSARSILYQGWASILLDSIRSAADTFQPQITRGAA